MSMVLDKSLLQEVALVKSGISEAFIEKDWFVTQVMKILVENPHPDFSIIFTGGTCLSKAHKLIERFSEDIDFRLIAPNLEAQSASKVRKILSDFKKHITELLKDDFQILKVEARDANRHLAFHLAYPTICKPAEVLRPHIKLEFILSNLFLPAVELPVASFINEVSRHIPEIKGILCINPVENAADKLSALVWRISSRMRGIDDKQPDIVRHLHDLARLSELALNHNEFANLAKTTIERDAPRAQILDNMSTQEKILKMIEILETDNQYPKEYDSYVKAMVYNLNLPVPTFEEAVDKVRMLINRIE